MVEHSDHWNFYRMLGISFGASAEEVARTYNLLLAHLSQEPNPSHPRAAARLAALSGAYAVLSDPDARARYDAACTAAKTESTRAPHIAAVACFSCGTVSAQPRYIVFTSVISLLLVTFRRMRDGVFCPSCAQWRAVWASAITWLFGWWGFPFGPIYSVVALAENLANGDQPGDRNARILEQQALYFWSTGQRELGAAVLHQALRFAKSPALRDSLHGIEEAITKAMAPAIKAPLIDKRQRRSWGFWVQILFPAAAFTSIFLLIAGNNLTATIAKQSSAHVGEQTVAVLAQPSPDARVLRWLRPFENLTVVAGSAVDGYQRVSTRYGLFGYVTATALLPGDGAAAHAAKCFPAGPVKLSSGEILRQTTTGPHGLKIKNDIPRDAVVKLRDSAGRTVLSFFVEVGGETTISAVPEGTFLIELATGWNFSPVCGYFLESMVSRRLDKEVAFVTTVEDGNLYAAVVGITLKLPPISVFEKLETDASQFARD